uniref:Uncharacterized protein n=1 Tax=Acrobeloides nanus TaxID=290746 RepID=A0A914ECB1_9BILA
MKCVRKWVLDFNQSDHYGGKKSKACVPITIETAWCIYKQAVSLPIINTDNPSSLILFKNSSFYQSVNTGVLDGNLLIQALYKKDIIAQRTSSLRGTGHEILRKCIQCIFKSDHFKEYKQIYMPVTYGHEFHPESNQSLNGHAVLIIFERDPDRLRISVFVLGITPTMNLDKRYDTVKFTDWTQQRTMDLSMVGDEGSEAMCNFRHFFIAEQASASKNIAEQASTSKK